LTVLLAPAASPEEDEGARAASDAVVEFLATLVAEKRRHPDDALVSALISARDGEEQLSEEELMSTIFQLIVAGHDTTSSLLGNCVVAFLRHPEQLSRLRSDASAMPNAIEELLRYDAPVPHSTFRYALEPIDIGGVT